MKHRTALLPVLFAAILLAGCQTSPEQRLAVANDAFASTLDVLSDAREAGKISDETQTAVIAPVRRTIDSLLDLAYAAVESGDTIKLRMILAEIDKELAPLLRERFKFKRVEK